MSSSPLILIDVSGFIFRAYHALPPLTRADGTPVGAVFGLCSMLLKFLGMPYQSKGQLTELLHLDMSSDSTESTAPYPGVVAVFDAGRETFRQTVYPDYKAHRPPPPEDLIPQFALCRDVCAAFHLPCVEMKGYEADDVIATYVTQAQKAGRPVVLVTADKDLMQLMDDNVFIIDPMKGKQLTHDDVLAKFGVPPSQVIEVQSLMGDSTDNIPGVPGVGPKTAAALIQEYGTLENMYAHIDDLKASKRKDMLIQHKDDAFISKQLVTLCRDVPVPLSIPILMTGHSTEQGVAQQDITQSLLSFFKAQDFKGLVKRMEAASGTVNTDDATVASTSTAPTQASPIQEAPRAHIPITNFTEPPYACLYTQEDLMAWCELVQDILVVDVETTSLNPREAALVGLSLATYGRRHPGDALMLHTCYIPVGHTQTLMEKPQMPLRDALSVLAPLFQNPSILKVGHNLKYDKSILHKYGLTLAPYADTMVMSYALDGGRHRHNLDFLIQHYFNHTMIAFKDVVTSTKTKPMTFADVPINQALAYAGEDAAYTYRLYHHLKQRLDHEPMNAVNTLLDQPLVDVLLAMESRGIAVDEQALLSLGQEFQRRATDLEHEIYTLSGCTFNIASPKQISEILFDTMNLPKPKKTKTGAFTTDADVLEDLSHQGYEIAQKIIDWRQLMKLISTYVEGLRQAQDPTTKRVHTSYHQVGTTTGRLSSSEPNLQNIPIRTGDGRAIRGCFHAQDGFQLVRFDYSQIELRLLAHVADIDTLKQAFCDGVDIHTLTAHQVFQTPLAEVSAQQRRSAKAINFGIIYGISAYGLSQQLKISQGEAKDAIAAYFRQYPGIQQYMEDQVTYARDHGYVTTLFGRRCYTPGIDDKRAPVRRFAERQAINAPLQGSNADIIRRAMIQLHHRYLASDDVRMLLQVHDELVFEIQSDRVTTEAPCIQKIMEGSAHVSVPLIVEWHAGRSWLK